MTGVKKHDPPLRRDKVSSLLEDETKEKESAVISRARATWPSGVARRACHVRVVRTRARSAVKRFRAGLVNVVAIDLSIAARDRRAPIVSLFGWKRAPDQRSRGLKMQLGRHGGLHYIGNLSRKIIAPLLLFSLIFLMLLCERSSS